MEHPIFQKVLNFTDCKVLIDFSDYWLDQAKANPDQVPNHKFDPDTLIDLIQAFDKVLTELIRLREIKTDCPGSLPEGELAEPSTDPYVDDGYEAAARGDY